MCLRGLSRSHARRGRGKVTEETMEKASEDSNNGNKRLTGTNADVVDASSEYTGAFWSIQ